MILWSRTYKLRLRLFSSSFSRLTKATILRCSSFGGIGMWILEYSEIQYRLCDLPISRVILINIDTYSIEISSDTLSIFIADDFTLNGKSTNLESVVKSSNIIQGRLLKILLVSLVLPIINDLPAVNTGVLYESLYSVEATIYGVGCSYVTMSSSLHIAQLLGNCG